MRVLLALAALAAVASADLYLHAPPGSNDRNRERNDNRNNGARLFDSQNNNKGGYAWRGSATMMGSLEFANIPDPLVYYSTSRLRLEWTNQHSCGPNPNIHCQLVIQYACHDPKADIDSMEWLQGLRDGAPMSPTIESSDNTYDGYRRRTFLAQQIPGTNTAQNQDGTERIPDNAFPDSTADRENFYYRGGLGGMEFGMHEGYNWYKTCKNTIRNKGLYISDQNVNGNDASKTRQNPNGNRNGLECPEERDYYPYWRPTPWRDVAVLVSNTSWCEYYKDNSQNVVDTGYCDCDSDCQAAGENQLIPITEANCTEAGGDWKIREALGGEAPDCLYHPWGRDNHLGNADPVDEDGNIVANKYEPVTAFYDWVVPKEAENKHCVLRLRYNMSSDDAAWMAFAEELPEDRSVIGFDFSCRELRARRNDPNIVRIAMGLPLAEDIEGLDPQCTGVMNETHKPLFERPYVSIFPDLESVDGAPRQLAIAINTDQVARTFQDRTHVFKVLPRPGDFPGGTVFNLGVRGRRGNIVQAYPSVEYDFTPTILEARASDWVHIQFHGSDFNDPKNANNGEGWRYSDRFNMVETASEGENYPLPLSQMKMFEPQDAEFFALLGQTGCTDYYYNGNDNDRTTVQNQADNCAQLNRAPNRFPQDPEDGMVRFPEGKFTYVSTRNNCFSNRSHKGSLRIGEGTSSALTSEEKAAVAVGVIAAVAVAVGGLLLFAKKKPRSAVGNCFRNTAACLACKKGAGSAAKAGTASQAPTMDYQRH